MALTGEDVTGRKVVLFDFDGTLADTIVTITGTARRALLAHGMREGDLGDLRRLVGPPFPQAFTLVYGIAPDEAARITEDYRRLYGELGAAAWPLFDGVRELLLRLRAEGRRCAVATAKRTELVERALSDNGVAELFDARLGKASDADESKAVTVGRALDALGADASDAVMVGDRRFDVEAAAAHGIPCVGVLYGGSCERAELVDAGACAVAGSVAELGRILLG